VRESVFNVLAARLDFDGLRVLDLYAGSGALGLEALSRGAQSVLFIESDRRAAEVIDRNIATVGLIGATVRRGTVATVLAAGSGSPVDLVFADPPYEVGNAEVESVLAALAGHGWLGEDTVAVIERPSSSPSLTWPPGWEVWPERRYGDTRIEAGCRRTAAC
jgi:16S rRNA (guanine(966)-N(2))-methyltransferase RsmD